MVALAVPRLEYFVPAPCLARPMLYAALDRLDRGDLIGAGVRLREAVRRFVEAFAAWRGCPLPQSKYTRTAASIRALRKAGHLDKWGASCLLEMVSSGNAAAHCKRVDAATLRGGISLLFCFLDGEGFAPHERQPIDTSHKPDNLFSDDDGDDDGADWWKGGAV